MKIFLLFLMINFSLQAKIIKHDSIGARLHDYSYQDFCTTMKAKSSLLISPVNLSEVECFNQKFKIADFCILKLPLEATFSRGFVVESEKKIYCEEANSVMISISCDSKKDLCKKPKTSCVELKKIYANRLEVTHASNIEQNLNCYYSKNIGDDIEEI